MPLTVDQLADFRADIGDQTSPYAFTDLELERLFVRAEDVYDQAKLLAYKQLLANAAKFYNYVAGFTRAEQEKVFDHIKTLHDLLEKDLLKSNQVRVVGISIVPPSHKEEPNDLLTGGNFANH